LDLLALLLVGLYVTAAVFVGLNARSKGQSWLLFFFVALILTPIFGLLIATFLPNSPSRMSGMRKSPACAEYISVEAKVCKHCTTQMPPPVHRGVIAGQQAERRLRASRGRELG
jgi:hypothetical protein